MNIIKGASFDIISPFIDDEELTETDLMKKLPHWTSGAIKAIARRCVRQGYLKSRVEKIPGECNRPRRFYKRTQQGTRALFLQLDYWKTIRKHDSDFPLRTLKPVVQDNVGKNLDIIYGKITQPLLTALKPGFTYEDVKRGLNKKQLKDLNHQLDGMFLSGFLEEQT
jgi:DNA-binding PadR family transcriptional regulator